MTLHVQQLKAEVTNCVPLVSGKVANKTKFAGYIQCQRLEDRIYRHRIGQICGMLHATTSTASMDEASKLDTTRRRGCRRSHLF